MSVERLQPKLQWELWRLKGRHTDPVQVPRFLMVYS